MRLTKQLLNVFKPCGENGALGFALAFSQDTKNFCWAIYAKT